jgi:hypothetical protein
MTKSTGQRPQRRVQVGVVGAMQRAHPALTQLWLQWTGIDGLDTATFDTARTEENGESGSSILFSPKKGLGPGWGQLCDVMALPPDAAERRTMPVQLSARHPAHTAFWNAMIAREMNEVDGPLEWWWRLAIMRHRGLRTASRALIAAVFGLDDRMLKTATVGFDNPSIKPEARRAEDLLTTGRYSTPTHLLLVVPVGRDAKKQGLAFSLDDAKLRSRLTAALTDIATARLA